MSPAFEIPNDQREPLVGFRRNWFRLGRSPCSAFGRSTAVECAVRPMPVVPGREQLSLPKSLSGLAKASRASDADHDTRVGVLRSTARALSARPKATRRMGRRLRRPRVTVVESAEVGNRGDLAGPVLDDARLWRVAVETQVSTRLVVVARVFRRRTRRRWRSPRAMTWSVQSRRIDPMTRSAKGFCHGDFLALMTCVDAEDAHGPLERTSVDGVAIAVDVLGDEAVAGERFEDLPGGPLVGGVARDVDVQDLRRSWERTTKQ